MKRFAIVLIAIIVMGSIAFSGDMAKQGQWGVQTAVGPTNLGSGLGLQSAGFKFMISDNSAIRAGLAFSSFSPGGGGNSQSEFGIGAGFEYHMTAVGGVSPYLGLQAGYDTYSPGGGANSPNLFSVGGVYGGEYFFSSNFSMAGEVGIKFQSYSSGASGASASTMFGTTGVASLIATWYLN